MLFKRNLIAFVLLINYAAGFQSLKGLSQRKMKMSMSAEVALDYVTNFDFHAVSHWIDYTAQGIADSAIVASPDKVCPGFGEPGWGPFCFLNGNPVFKAFDAYQAFIQSSVVNLHDFLQNAGIKDAYGPSIILFTILVRILLFPLTYQQLASSQKTLALNPKLKEIREKYADNKDLQNQMVALLYQETKVNPLAGCLPALFQIPVFLALYRSFLNLASENKLVEPFLWLPNLEGPTYGERSTNWLTGQWQEGFVPPLGWHDTLSFIAIPILLVIAQSISLRVLTPPSDDPAVQSSQRILKYLPLMLGYFSLSVPAGLGVYWVTNNILSTVTTASIKAYFKANPMKEFDINLDKLANSEFSAYMNPAWGYVSRNQMIEEAKLNYRPSRQPKIPLDYMS